MEFSSNYFFQISHDCVTENACLSRIFDKICLKAIKTFFFQYVICDQGTGGLNFFGGGDIQQKRKIQTFWLAGRLPPILPLSGASRSPHKKNSEEGAWSAYCNDFEESKWECFLSNKWIYSKFKDKKEVTNSLIWHSIYWRLSIHFQVRSITKT